MVGTNTLVIVSSTNQEVCEILGIPASLKGLSGQVLCSAVLIKNHSAYADAVMSLADDRWS